MASFKNAAMGLLALFIVYGGSIAMVFLIYKVTESRIVTAVSGLVFFFGAIFFLSGSHRELTENNDDVEDQMKSKK